MNRQWVHIKWSTKCLTGNEIFGLGITDEQIFRELSRIRVGLVAHDNLKDPQIVVEDVTPIQARIFSKLDLGRYLEHNIF